jgi:hypothetical protein
MARQLVERLRSVRVGEPAEAGGLQVFPLSWEPGGTLRYTTLDDALAAGLLEVTEVSAGGSVPALKVLNKGETLAFLMAGEHLSGGKQNRVLNASIMIAAHTELPIPVSCVERGRWGYRSPQFGGSGSSSHATLRKMMHSQATMGYRSGGKPSSDQASVWREVDRKLGESGSLSDTMCLDKAYEDTATELGVVAGQLAVPAGACGAVFAHGGRVVGCDLFDQPGTLARLWGKLVRAYAIDARVAPADAPRVSADEVRAWLESAGGAREEVFPSPGVGADVRLEGPTVQAACLLVEDQPVHVEMFAQGA